IRAACPACLAERRSPAPSCRCGAPLRAVRPDQSYGVGQFCASTEPAPASWSICACGRSHSGKPGSGGRSTPAPSAAPAARPTPPIDRIGNRPGPALSLTLPTVSSDESCPTPEPVLVEPTPWSEPLASDPVKDVREPLTSVRSSAEPVRTSALPQVGPVAPVIEPVMLSIDPASAPVTSPSAIEPTIGSAEPIVGDRPAQGFGGVARRPVGQRAGDPPADRLARGADAPGRAA